MRVANFLAIFKRFFKFTFFNDQFTVIFMFFAILELIKTPEF